jgi:hypothetical protein
MDQTKIKAQLDHWLTEFVEANNSELTDWPPCPYAKAARLSGMISTVFCEVVEFNSVIQESIEQLQNKDVIIQFKTDELERVKDMKLKLSTKMLGESLEQHCEIEFNKLRATAFPNAYFEKDNNARGGSKGDFIFRDHDESGTEIVSIMFEMKNESDGSSNRGRNEDFLVVNVPDEKSIELSGSPTSAPKQVRVIGRQVDDFQSVDYQQIYMTAISALQQVDRRLQLVEQREAKVMELERKAARVESLERDVAELRKLVAGIQAGASKNAGSASVTGSASGAVASSR